MKIGKIFERLPAWKWAVVLLVIICLIGLFSKAGHISTEIKQKACNIITEYGLDCSKNLKVSGRDIVVQGEIPPDIDKAELLKRIKSIEGVRTVQDRLETYQLQAPWIKAKISKKHVKIEGLLPDTVSIDELKEFIAQKFPSKTIELQIKTAKQVQSPSWLEELPDLLALAAQANDAEIEISNQGLKIVGYVTSQTQKDVIASKLEDLLENLALTNLLLVKVPEDVLLEEALAEILTEPITFMPGTDELTPDAQKLLDSVANVLKEFPCIKIEIAAYTDNIGDDDYNKELTQKRAESVARYLISKGVLPDRLIPKGYGEANPIADNNSAAGRIKNRRIEFRIISEKEQG